jgi:hypothetical protein
MTGYISKKMLGAARLPDTPSARAYLDKILEDDDTQVYGDALTVAYQSGYYDGKKAAQPAQEPVGKFAKFTDGIWREVTDGSPGVSLYAAPQRPWVDLTDEQILALFDSHNVYGSKWLEFARAVLAKSKEKNT